MSRIRVVAALTLMRCLMTIFRITLMSRRKRISKEVEILERGARILATI